MEKKSEKKKLRILCLHGFRGSGEILRRLIFRWPESVTRNLDLVFLDAPFPAQGRSPLEGFFDPPYFEWFQSNKDFTEFYNFEECLEYIEEFMLKNGPFDGVLGFSQGAVLGAAIPGMQREGVALTKVPKIKFVILISGAKFGGPTYGIPKLAANAFSSPINCPSLHFLGLILEMRVSRNDRAVRSAYILPFPDSTCEIPLGETDFQKKDGEILLECFVDPQVIHHSKGHTIPKLDDSSPEIMLGFVEKIQQL